MNFRTTEAKDGVGNYFDPVFVVDDFYPDAAAAERLNLEVANVDSRGSAGAGTGRRGESGRWMGSDATDGGDVFGSPNERIASRRSREIRGGIRSHAVAANGSPVTIWRNDAQRVGIPVR